MPPLGVRTFAPAREAPVRPWFSRPGLRAAVTGILLAAVVAGANQGGGELGLPFTRFYSFDEIGNASRGARLDFDPLGRIAVTRGGACVVLNDATWIDIADREASNPAMESLHFGPEGEAYYCAFGAWGTARLANGRLHPASLVPATHPKWVTTANFNDIVPARSGVFFTSLSGIVYWERATGRHSFHELPSVARAFLLGDHLFVSTYAGAFHRLDPAAGTLVQAPATGLTGTAVDQVTAYDASRVLLSVTDGRLFLFDGTAFTPFPGPLGGRTAGRISALRRMADGNFAIAINGVGLYLATPDGEILSALTTPEYHRVTDVAAREPGVLWIVTENGVEKILYNSALTSFGQRQGLPLSWPQLVRWEGRIVVASGGRLYEAVEGPANDTTRFQLVPGQPEQAVWAIATDGEHLLVGTNQGVYVRNRAGGFDQVLRGLDAARLASVDGIFLVLGAAEIAALRSENGQWRECAPRVPGVGYPHVVHATPRAAWLELGPGKAARVRHHDGLLNVRLFEEFPWPATRWINIGFAGDLVALSAVPDGRLYFDDRRETFMDGRPELGRWLDQAPYPVNRFRQDRKGVVWATHDEGLLTLEVHNGSPVFDATTFGRVNARFPHALLLPDDDVWLAAGQSLYHVNRNFVASPRPAYRPALVSVADGRTGRELLAVPGTTSPLPELPYETNSLLLRFFAGGYAKRHPPAYEFRLGRGAESRAVVGNGSLLALTDLREGRYRLEVRLAGMHEPADSPLTVEFAIAPPWYRTWYAYTGYGLGFAGLLYALLRWTTQRTRLQNAELEQLVAARTNELRVAMQRLNDETRQTATLAERNRLAGEIHDSLQQGLSGLMLQLDATLKLTDLSDDVRSRLIVARNMVSFTRHEVQHAVWDMETPLLENTELSEALNKITTLIGPGTAEVRIAVKGRPAEISPAVKHHLLRIAQEAITNAVRHAAARTIVITLAYEPEGVTLEVTDDGNGFAPGDVLAKAFGHFGLRGLRGRAGKIGGNLRIQSAPGQGTTVHVSVRTVVPVV